MDELAPQPARRPATAENRKAQEALAFLGLVIAFGLIYQRYDEMGWSERVKLNGFVSLLFLFLYLDDIWSSIEGAVSEALESPSVHKPAGHLTLTVAEIVYSQDTYENIFEAAVADFRGEIREAFRDDRIGKAWLRRIQLYLWVLILGLRHLLELLLHPVKPLIEILKGN